MGSKYEKSVAFEEKAIVAEEIDGNFYPKKKREDFWWKFEVKSGKSEV